MSVGKTKKRLKRTIAEKGDILNDILETFAALIAYVTLESKMAALFSDLLQGA